jgi:hypothetical protein
VTVREIKNPWLYVALTLAAFAMLAAGVVALLL